MSLTDTSGLALGALALVLIAAASPQSPPTAAGLADPDAFQSIWSLRLGPANLIEIGTVLIGAAGLFALALAPTREVPRSSFDLTIAATAVVLAGLQGIALFRGLPADRFLLFDVERVLMPLIGYVLVSRAIADRVLLRRFVLLLAGVLLARWLELVVVHGLIGSTEFGTAKGGTALLITEDAFLISIPVLLAWGMLLDRRLTAAQGLGAVALALAALAVDSLSLRRGALLFLTATLVLRSLALPRRHLMLIAAVVAIALAGLLVANPKTGVGANVGYALKSAVGLESDASTSQRAAETRDFGRNVDGIDWVIGRGLGTIWRAAEPGPVQLASFGSKETAYVRIGWHAYGLDWLYKFGLLGAAVLLGALAAAILSGVRSARAAPGSAGSFLLSLTVVLPFLALFALTNLRDGLLTGVVLGILSRAADLYRRDRVPVTAERRVLGSPR